MANLMARTDITENFLQRALTGWRRPGAYYRTVWNGVDRRFNPPQNPQPNTYWFNLTSNVTALGLS